MHTSEYLSGECFPNLPENLPSLWGGDATNVAVSLSGFTEDLVQLFWRCLRKVKR